MLISILCCSCRSYVYVRSPWPRIYRTKNIHKTISLRMDELDPLGAEKKQQLIDDITKIVTYTAALEASLDAYAEAREEHNVKFKEQVVGKKETSP